MYNGTLYIFAKIPSNKYQNFPPLWDVFDQGILMHFCESVPKRQIIISQNCKDFPAKSTIFLEWDSHIASNSSLNKAEIVCTFA